MSNILAFHYEPARSRYTRYRLDPVHLELLEALDKCGAGTVDIGVIVYKRITFDRKGNVIAEKPQLQIVTSWDRLRQVLLKAIDRQRYHFGYVCFLVVAPVSKMVLRARTPFVR